MQTIPLEPVDGLTVTTLVDNVADLLLTDDGMTGDALRAEHGFSCLVTAEKAGRTTRVLVPCHCTGWRAIHAIAARFPEAFIQSSVGTRFELTCADS